MKSTFFHVGVNRTMALQEGLLEPEIRSDGSIPYVPLPDHRDPDFENFTYGDPWGRLERFDKGDIAWFIESGTVSRRDWGYYLVSYFVIEDIYLKRSGVWNKEPKNSHADRIAKNAHEVSGDFNYAMILGERETTRMLLENPFRISKGEDAFDNVKRILGLPEDKPTRGYWFKKWFGDEPTRKLLKEVLRAQQKSRS